MYSSTTSNRGPLLSEDSSGSSRNLLIKPFRRREASNLSSLASEEDDEVQFDSKQLFFFSYLNVASFKVNFQVNFSSGYLTSLDTKIKAHV